MILFYGKFFSIKQNMKEKNGSYWLDRIYYFWNCIYENGDNWALSGSIIWILSCILWLIPYFRKK